MPEPKTEEIKKWASVTLTDGIEDLKSGQTYKEVFMRKAKGKDTLAVSNDMRVKSADDITAGLLLCTQICKVKIGDDEFRSLTFEEIKEMTMEDISLLNSLFAEVNKVGMDRTSFLSKMKIPGVTDK